MGDSDPTESRGRDARYDVVIVSDFTAGGDLAGDLAAEIRAQARAGYTTALAPVETRAGQRVDQRVAVCVRRGLAHLLLPGDDVEARLLVLRLTPLADEVPAWPVRVRAERVAAVFDTWHAGNRRLLASLDEQLRRRYGRPPDWVATSDAAREALAREAAKLSGLPWSWGPVVEVAGGPRAAPGDGRVTVGWARPAPGSVASMRRVRDLGRRRLARSFPVVDLDGPSPVLCSDLDVVVCPAVPDPSLPPPRVLLEALAAGVLVVLPPEGGKLFGDACGYADPRAAAALVRRLPADPEGWSERSRRATEYAAEHFGADRHLARLQELVGAPAGTPIVLQRPEARPRRRRVMFVSSNGAGVGHLTRLLAIARRLPDDVEPVFFTLSQAVSVVRGMGYPCEYLASTGYSGMEQGAWRTYLRDRLAQLIAEYGPDVVVFDGTTPYRGLLDVAKDHPHVEFVWSRRAMWKPGEAKRSAVEQAKRRFRLVIEPGELAEELDRGLTVHDRGGVERVAPVTLLDRSELLSREDARVALGLDPDRPAVLVQLGAGNIDDATSIAAVVHEHLREVGGLQICATAHPITRHGEPDSPDLHVLSVYPLSRYFAAFDFGITAPGYNSFHELVTFGLPAIYVPNTRTALDDQAARGRWAERAGVGLCVDPFTPERFAASLARMLDPEQRDAMRRCCEARARENGAAAAAALVEELLHAVPPAASPWGRVDVSSGARFSPASSLRALTASTKARLRTNALLRRLLGRAPLLPGAAAPSARSGMTGVPAAWGAAGHDLGDLPIVLLLCLGMGAAAIGRLAQGVTELQSEHRSFRPLFLVDCDDFRALRRTGFLFEYVVPREEWEKLTGADDWPTYVERRLEQIVAAFRPEVVVDHSLTDPGGPLDPGVALTGSIAGQVAG